MVTKIIKIIGIILVITGLVILTLIFGPVLKQEGKYQANQIGISNSIISLNSKNPVDQNFGLVIEKVGINVKVFPNISDQDPKQYLPVLKKGVAHALGSVSPGQPGYVFIFAHSANTPLTISQFNAVFYLLTKLRNSDEIVVYYQTRKFTYQVVDRKVMAPEFLTGYLKTLQGNTLVLQTCYPPGTTLKRLLIIAKEIN